VNLTTHLHVVQRLRMQGALPPHTHTHTHPHMTSWILCTGTTLTFCLYLYMRASQIKTLKIFTACFLLIGSVQLHMVGSQFFFSLLRFSFDSPLYMHIQLKTHSLRVCRVVCEGHHDFLLKHGQFSHDIPTDDQTHFYILHVLCTHCEK
jgi:hypothetical protein